MVESPWPYLLPLATAVVVVGAVMARAGRDMTRSGGPGIVAFEFAEDVREVHRIFTRWGGAGKRAAQASLRMDYLWLLLYSALLFVAARAVGHAAAQAGIAWLETAGWLAAVGALVAGALDAVENTALLRQLSSGPSAGAARVARNAAQAKSALILLAVLFILYAFGRVQLAG